MTCLVMDCCALRRAVNDDWPLCVCAPQVVVVENKGAGSGHDIAKVSGKSGSQS
jgi:hypothetical protein